jgi:hypothetical protein
LKEKLEQLGINLITRNRRNMKNNKDLSNEEENLLKKRSIIETIFSKLKLFDKLWHSRHRCVENAFCHLLSCLIAYQINPNKPNVREILWVS